MKIKSKSVNVKIVSISHRISILYISIVFSIKNKNISVAKFRSGVRAVQLVGRASK